MIKKILRKISLWNVMIVLGLLAILTLILMEVSFSAIIGSWCDPLNKHKLAYLAIEDAQPFNIVGSSTSDINATGAVRYGFKVGSGHENANNSLLWLWVEGTEAQTGANGLPVIKYGPNCDPNVDACLIGSHGHTLMNPVAGGGIKEILLYGRDMDLAKLKHPIYMAAFSLDTDVNCFDGKKTGEWRHWKVKDLEDKKFSESAVSANADNIAGQNPVLGAAFVNVDIKNDKAYVYNSTSNLIYTISGNNLLHKALYLPDIGGDFANDFMIAEQNSGKAKLAFYDGNENLTNPNELFNITIGSSINYVIEDYTWYRTDYVGIYAVALTVNEPFKQAPSNYKIPIPGDNPVVLVYYVKRGYQPFLIDAIAKEPGASNHFGESLGTLRVPGGGVTDTDYLLVVDHGPWDEPSPGQTYNDRGRIYVYDGEDLALLKEIKVKDFSPLGNKPTNVVGEIDTDGNPLTVNLAILTENRAITNSRAEVHHFDYDLGTNSATWITKRILEGAYGKEDEERPMIKAGADSDKNGVEEVVTIDPLGGNVDINSWVFYLGVVGLHERDNTSDNGLRGVFVTMGNQGYDKKGGLGASVYSANGISIVAPLDEGPLGQKKSVIKTYKTK